MIAIALAVLALNTPTLSSLYQTMALLIIASQLRPLLGLGQETDIAQVLMQPGLIQPLTVVVGVATLATVYAARRTMRCLTSDDTIGLCQFR